MKQALQLNIIFKIDGLISSAFGLATGLFQSEIFNTAVDLKSAGATGNRESLIESALLTLSGYYVLAGSVLLLLSEIPVLYAKRLCVVITAHHALMAVKGATEAGSSWVTGNPWWDVSIHSIFVAVYLTSLFSCRGD